MIPNLSRDERAIERTKAEITAMRSPVVEQAKTTDFKTLSERLMRICFSEANRLANHHPHGAPGWSMENLYAAANEAKEALNG